ncbi:MAG: TRAP transporter large permease [Propioniciclava sp.]
MSTAVVAVIALALLFGLLLIRVPVGFSLLASGSLGLLMLDGFEIATRGLATEPYTAVAKYSMIVIPMFILMGMFAMESGVAVGAFRLANKAFGRLPGGLGIATVVVCAVFAAVSGSSPATVATVGRITVPEMRRAGYTREFTAGIVGTAGTLGVLIPPSIVAVIFGVTTEVSIGALLIAGILPGLVSVIVLSTYIVVQAVRNPALINDTSYRPGTEGEEETAGAGSRRDLFALVGVGVMFTVVIGGIYTGFFTATESAAFGALTGLLILIVSQARTGRFFSAFLSALREAASTTTMIFVIMIGAAVFTNFLVRSGITRMISDGILGLGLSPYMLVIGTLLLMLPLGMFLDATSIIVITMPILWPVLAASGVDGAWFGIMVIIMIEIGLITPPVGINGFVLTGIAEDISIEQTFKGLVPFVFVQLAIVAIIFLIPGTATFLPGLMRG